MKRLRVGVLVSGRGSNLLALIESSRQPLYPAEITAVCANKDAPALEHARRAEIPCAVFARSEYSGRAQRDLAMAEFLKGRGVELVVCAGYDAILAPVFTQAFRERIVNVHPSLLPAFAGTMDAPAQALAAGLTETGCTVHLMTDDVDAGPVLAQRRVPVRPGDTPQSLHARIQVEEHRVLPEVVRQMAEQILSLRV